ncbi:cellulose synthase/poly-beta-1,6-N-acetylglucosamine synthase-like glycosyltransferase [Aurantimicrobium minutum]|nr:cellulose synthase/poly-beta-1,6-N-acetylglucosamine synthase-like glycosyltransferase [Aurantimicrobium minutum]
MDFLSNFYVALQAGFAQFVAATALPLLLYFLLINSSYLGLVLLAGIKFVKHLRRASFSLDRTVAASPLTPSVSVIMSAFNEEAVIVSSVRSVLDLRHPHHELIVVNDGSTDATLQALIDGFGLVNDTRPIALTIPLLGSIRGVWTSPHANLRLTVVDSDNSGKTDSINCALNIARNDLIAIVDADSILDPDALIKVSQPFADDPDRVIASGGVVRVANGSQVLNGRVVNVRMPSRLLPQIQAVEYLRAFLLGRAGWSQLEALILISGAFGMFRRDVVMAIGGMDTSSIGEDFELVMRMHEWMRKQTNKYRVVFVVEPVSWTEVPETFSALARQRRRWHRGLWEVLWKYKRMSFNPRYGVVGMLAVPYYWFFELLAPVLEIAGLIIVPLGLVLGVIDPVYVVFFILIAYVYAVIVTLAAMVIEEASFHRYDHWSDLWKALFSAVAENFGYRQLTAIWRVQGWWQAIRGREASWGEMNRSGFNVQPAGKQSL